MSENQTSIQKLNFMSICDMAQSNDNKISIDTYHINIMGDLAGAAFLTQLRYWFFPSKNGGHSRVSIRKDGKLWLAKKDEDWWSECYVTPKQVRRIKAKLVDLGIVEIKLFKFNGAPTVHYHLNLEKYTELYHEQRVVNAKTECYKQKKQEKRVINNPKPVDSAQKENSILPKGTNPFCPNGQIYNISSKHIISAYDLKKHVEDVFFNQNDKEMFLWLRGKPLEEFKSLDAEKQKAFLALVTLPPAKEGGESVNPVQALKIVKTNTVDQIIQTIKIIDQHQKEGTIIKNVGSYITWILEKKVKSISPNININKNFWKSIRSKINQDGIKEHVECLEIDDFTAIYFHMDHELFKNTINTLFFI